jgi:hypothetical protein
MQRPITTALLLMAAGIFQHHVATLNEAEKLRDRWIICKECGRPQKLSLDLNVRVCFWIVLSGLGLTFLASLYERKAYRSLLHAYQYLRKVILYLYGKYVGSPVVTLQTRDSASPSVLSDVGLRHPQG